MVQGKNRIPSYGMQSDIYHSNIHRNADVCKLIAISRNWNATGKKQNQENSAFIYTIKEIHVDARFDITKNKGFWLLRNDEKEIDDTDWSVPTEPNNPNLLAIVTGCASCPMPSNWNDERVFIREWSNAFFLW